MTVSTLFPRKRYIAESTQCVCGHTYGDHLARAPHGCKEDHPTKKGHVCACSAFQFPAGIFPDSAGTLYRDRTLQAAVSGVDQELHRALGNLPNGSGGFGSFD
jgi:hypothetical protein